MDRLTRGYRHIQGLRLAGTVQNLAFLNNVARQLRIRNMGVLTPSAYGPENLTLADKVEVTVSGQPGENAEDCGLPDGICGRQSGQRAGQNLRCRPGKCFGKACHIRRQPGKQRCRSADRCGGVELAATRAMLCWVYILN